MNRPRGLPQRATGGDKPASHARGTVRGLLPGVRADLVLGAALGVALGAVLSAPAARAADLGRIEARFGDAELTFNTVTTERGQGVDASASIRPGSRMTEIILQGHPGPAFTTHDVFSVDIRYLGAYEPASTPMSVDILYMPEGMGGPFWTSRGAASAPVIRVLALDVWGAVGAVDLLFAGELCFKERITVATDLTNCREVTGRIETELFVDRAAQRVPRPGPDDVPE